MQTGPEIRSASLGLLKGMPHRVLAGNLLAYCVVDLPEHMAPLYDSELEVLGIGQEKLWAKAFENLRRREFRFRYFAGQVGQVMQEDVYVSSLFIDEQFWETVERKCGGEHLAMIPCWNMLVFIHPDSDHLAEMIKRCADIFSEDSAAISADVFCRRNGAWQVWPVPNHLKP